MLRPSATVLLTAIAAAQAPPILSPAGATQGFGGLHNTYPFAIGPGTYQQVHSRSSFTSPAAASVTHLSFRPTHGALAYEVDVEITMANAPHGADLALPTYADNVVAGSEVTVFTRKNLSLPSIPERGWHLRIPLDAAFAWAGSHLAWGCEVFGNNGGNGRLEYTFDSWSRAGRRSTLGSGVGCASALGTGPAEHFSKVLDPGQTSSFQGYSYVPSGGLTAFLTFGASTTSANGLPLPFDLGLIGAPGCLITNDIVASISGTTQADARGSVELFSAIPNVSTLSGKRFHTQFVFLQPGANALGAFVSNGLTNTIGTWRGITRIFGDPGATQGFVDSGSGIAIGLD